MPDEAVAQLGVVLLGVVARPVDPVAAVVGRFAGAPQDPIVGRQSVILEEGADVGDPLPALPADRRHLSGRQRLAHQDVVVQRQEAVPQARDEVVRVGIGRQDDLAGAHFPGRPAVALRPRLHTDAGAVGADALDPGPFEDGHAGALRLPPEPLDQLHRIEDAAAGVERAAQIAIAVHLGARLRGAQQPAVIDAQPPRGVHGGAHLLEVRRRQRHVQLPGPLQVAVDAALVEKADQRIEVLRPEPRQAFRLIPAEMLHRQRMGVIDRLDQHAGVAPGGAVGGEPLLEHDDVGLRLEPLEGVRRPQPGEAGPDDGDVGLAPAAPGRAGLAGAGRHPVTGLFDGAHGARSISAPCARRDRPRPPGPPG